MSATTAKTASKGTKSTEVIVGAAATALNRAVSSLADANSVAAKLEQVITEGVLKASNLEDQINDLQTTYKQKKAEMEFQLDLDFKTNREAFAKAFLAERDLAAIPNKELGGLKEELEVIKKDFSTKVAQEVGKVKGQLESDFKAQNQITSLTFQAKEAENVAKLNQKDEQIKSLTDQVTNWKDALSAERQAGIERAKAGAIGSINLGGASNGRG